MHNCHYKSQTKSSLSAVGLLTASLPSFQSLVPGLLYINDKCCKSYCISICSFTVALTAEQDFDAPSALTVHSLSLKHTLKQGQSQWGCTHGFPHIGILILVCTDISTTNTDFSGESQWSMASLSVLSAVDAFHHKDNQALKTSVLIEKPN